MSDFCQRISFSFLFCCCCQTNKSEISDSHPRVRVCLFVLIFLPKSSWFTLAFALFCASFIVQQRKGGLELSDWLDRLEMTMVKFLARQLEKNWCFSVATVVLVQLEQLKTEQLSNEFVSQMFVSGCFSLPIHTHSEGRASKYEHPSVYSGSSQVHGCTLGVATLIFHSAQLRAVLQPWSYSWPPLYPLVASTGSTLSASSRFLWASSLFPSEMRKNPPTPSRNGDVRFAGEASFCLFVLMVEPGGQHQNPLMVQSRHTRAKNRLIITSSVDPGKSCRQQGFRINRDVSFSVATSKNIPNSTPNLTLTLPDDRWMILCTDLTMFLSAAFAFIGANKK